MGHRGSKDRVAGKRESTVKGPGISIRVLQGVHYRGLDNYEHCSIGLLVLKFSILYSQVLIELIRATVLVRVALPGRRFQFCLPLAFYGLP